MWEYSFRATVRCVWVGNILYWVFEGLLERMAEEKKKEQRGKSREKKNDGECVSASQVIVFLGGRSLYFTRDHPTML